MSATAKLAALFAVPLAWAGPGPALAQEASGFTDAQLEQIAAPIALYPDALVSQIMMAATYPLEIVQASRWVKANPGVSGQALEEALKEQDWDPSVKSLCGFPDVVTRMNDNLEWTQDMGDAFLGQRAQLLDAVQRMRGKAYEAGNLKTTEQQTVTQQPDKIIVIESANPQVIYVPTYSPTVVYGPAWYYPTWYYPPLYAPPPAGYGLLAFGAGIAVGAAIWGDCNWGWGHGDVDVSVNHYNNFNRNTNIDARRNEIQNKVGDKGQWQHNAEHRKGVNYRDKQTAEKFGAKGGASRVTRDQARGYDRGGAGASVGTRDAGGRERAAGSRDVASARDAGSRSSRQASSQGSAWSGSRNPSFDRAASSRGSASRGGMGHGGGGRSRGGGGGGRRR